MQNGASSTSTSRGYSDSRGKIKMGVILHCNIFTNSTLPFTEPQKWMQINMVYCTLQRTSEVEKELYNKLRITVDKCNGCLLEHMDKYLELVFRHTVIIYCCRHSGHLQAYSASEVLKNM
jgi:hypothetical protein